MSQLTISSYYSYLEDLPLVELELELTNATADLTQAQGDYRNASTFGGFPAKQKQASRAKSAASQSIKFIKQAIKEKSK